MKKKSFFQYLIIIPDVDIIIIVPTPTVDVSKKDSLCTDIDIKENIIEQKIKDKSNKLLNNAGFIVSNLSNTLSCKTS